MAQNVIQLAQQMWDQFEQADDVEGNKFWRLKDGRPEWMQDVARKAHDNGEMLPNNFRYEYITDSLIKLTEADEDADDDDLDELGRFEADIYNNDLLKWIGSHLSRAWYCDQAMNEFGPMDFYTLVGAGQVMEKEEVFAQVLAGLREHAETLDDEDSDDEDAETEED